MTNATRPTAAEIDDLCIAFDTARAEVEIAQQHFSTAKGALLAAIQDHGYTPAHAEKTVRLEGVLYIADATTSSTIETVEPSIAELQLELSRLKRPRVFAQLFDRKVKHSLRKDAAGILKLEIGGFASEVQTRLLALFSSCFNVAAKAPSVTVDLAAALRKKEAEAAEKAAKKAAKAAKKAAA